MNGAQESARSVKGPGWYFVHAGCCGNSCRSIASYWYSSGVDLVLAGSCLAVMGFWLDRLFAVMTGFFTLISGSPNSSLTTVDPSTTEAAIAAWSRYLTMAGVVMALAGLMFATLVVVARRQDQAHGSEPLDPDPSCHTVGYWQAVLADVGRVFPTLINKWAPDAPRGLCGRSLVVAAGEACDSDWIELPKELCPVCSQNRRR